MSKHSFWKSRLDPTSKQAMLIFLICCFAGQTLFVYFDFLPTAALSAEGVEGRRLWHEHNCQSCHQVYGFGGFLGPDLTNASDHLSAERLDQILTVGAGVMPAFRFDTLQIASIAAYLRDLSQTGRGQARQLDHEGRDPTEVFYGVVAQQLDREQEPQAYRGYLLVRSRGCASCHVPFATRSIGPDQLTVTRRLTDQEILVTLADGRPPAMPVTGFAEAERRHVLAYFHWCEANIDGLRTAHDAASRPSLDLMAVPWWEFR